MRSIQLLTLLMTLVVRQTSNRFSLPPQNSSLLGANRRSFQLLKMKSGDITTIFKRLFAFFCMNQVFGRDKMYWFVPLYTEEDMKRLPALGGLDFRSRLEESEPLQSL